MNREGQMGKEDGFYYEPETQKRGKLTALHVGKSGPRRFSKKKEKKERIDET